MSNPTGRRRGKSEAASGAAISGCYARRLRITLFDVAVFSNDDMAVGGVFHPIRI
jgi:hypothetical protein